MNLKLKGKNIVVTGGAGFIGSHLVDRLIQEKPGCIIIVDNLFLGKRSNLELALQFSNVFFFKLSCTDELAMKKLLKKYSIEVVFNLAVVPLPVSLVNPKFCVDENVNIVMVLLELQRKGAFKTLIHFSSSEVYGTALRSTIKEDHPTKPLSPYAASKLAGDNLVLSYAYTFDIDVAIIRPFNNYGPRQNDLIYAGVIPLTIRRIQRGEAPIIYGNGLQSRDFIFVKDTVEAAIKIYQYPETRKRVINIGTGKETAIKNVVQKIVSLMRYKGLVVWDKKRPADVFRHKANIKLAYRLLDFLSATSFERGLKETVKWYIHNLYSV